MARDNLLAIIILFKQQLQQGKIRNREQLKAAIWTTEPTDGRASYRMASAQLKTQIIGHFSDLLWALNGEKRKDRGRCTKGERKENEEGVSLKREETNSALS